MIFNTSHLRNSTVSFAHAHVEEEKEERNTEETFMQKEYYNLWEPFFGGMYEVNEGPYSTRPLKDNPEMQERVENSESYDYVDITDPISGPYLRYDYDYDNGKDVKLFFTGRRSCVFNHVAGPIELIFADGHIEEITGNRINIPDPIPCGNETWGRWKKYNGNRGIKDILIFENGIVVLLASPSDGVWSYHMSAYKEGDLIARFNGNFPIEEERSFYEEMLNSDDAQPFVDKLSEKNDRLMKERFS